MKGHHIIISLFWKITVLCNFALVNGVISPHDTVSADYDILPIQQPNDNDDQLSPIINYTIPGLGGSSPTHHGDWDGHVAIIDPNRVTFSVLAPSIPCSPNKAKLMRTSMQSERADCTMAINGSPFEANGGCIGQCVADGKPVCRECSFQGSVSIGLVKSSNDSLPFWVVGSNLGYDLTLALNASQVIVGLDGDSWIIRSGLISSSVADRKDSPAPRTAMGLQRDGTLIFFQVDGCEHCLFGGPQGLTRYELAKELLKLDVFQAINLDGGGSSTIVGQNGHVWNFPTSWDVVPIRKERKVSTIVCVSMNFDNTIMAIHDGNERPDR